MTTSGRPDRHAQINAATKRWSERKKLEDPEAWRANRREIQRRWRVKHKLKDKAHHAVWNALRSGELVRPEQCTRCQNECVPEASHDDYSKPLEVEWLCRACHAVKDRITNS